MLITQAHAQTTTATTSTPAVPAPPDAGQAIIGNLGFVLMVVVAFYFLLIRPQQKRFKEHANMLSELKKGDGVVTGGGLVGKIDTINDDEIVVDLGNGVKVTALRSTIQSKNDALLKKASNDSKAAQPAKAAKTTKTAKSTKATKATKAKTATKTANNKSKK